MRITAQVLLDSATRGQCTLCQLLRSAILRFMPSWERPLDTTRNHCEVTTTEVRLWSGDERLSVLELYCKPGKSNRISN